MALSSEITLFHKPQTCLFIRSYSYAIVNDVEQCFTCSNVIKQ